MPTKDEIETWSNLPQDVRDKIKKAERKCYVKCFKETTKIEEATIAIAKKTNYKWKKYAKGLWGGTKMKSEEKSRQGIRITTEEYISHGKEYVKIKTISALKAKSLPEEYFEGTGNAVYLSEGGQRLFYKEEVGHYSELLIVGQVYVKRYFNTAMEYIKIAGIRLGAINKTRKEDPVIKVKDYVI